MFFVTLLNDRHFLPFSFTVLQHTDTYIYINLKKKRKKMKRICNCVDEESVRNGEKEKKVTDKWIKCNVNYSKNNNI
jgi:hypothetical protein